MLWLGFEPGPQDGMRRQIHEAMAAATALNVCSRNALKLKFIWIAKLNVKRHSKFDNYDNLAMQKNHFKSRVGSP